MMSEGEPPGPFCAFCGTALGVYEPLILIGRDGQAIRTSRLAHTEGATGGVIVHKDCYAHRQPWSEDTPV